jgi:hypothetical protein
MAQATPRHNNVIVDFQSKRDESSAAFFLPFLNRKMTLLISAAAPEPLPRRW